MNKNPFQKKKVIKIVAVILVLFVGAIMGGLEKASAQTTKPITLTGETWTPTMSPPARIIGPEFIKGLEKATDGMVKVNWNTASALGPVPELYTRLVQGVIDMGQFNIGYTPGVFPVTEMFELPLRFPSAEILTKAMIEIYKKGYCDKEYGDIKFLFYHCIGPYQLWTNVKITGVDGLVGKKLRCPSPTYVEVTKALGAVPVSMPAGEIYTSLQKGIIDGTWACGEMAIAFKIGEIAKYLIMTNIGTTTQTYGMNKKPYNTLPEVAKKYIEENWEKHSLFGGRTFDQGNEKGFEFASKNKVETIHWNEAELKKMNKMIVPVFSDWVKKVEAKGIPGKKALTELHQILEKMGVKDPFILP